MNLISLLTQSWRLTLHCSCTVWIMNKRLLSFWPVHPVVTCDHLWVFCQGRNLLVGFTLWLLLLSIDVQHAFSFFFHFFFLFIFFHFCKTQYLFIHKVLILHSFTGGHSAIQRANPDEFIHIFVNNRHKQDKLMEFLEHMVKVQPRSSALVYNTLVELYLQDCSHEPDISVSRVRLSVCLSVCLSVSSIIH